VRLGTAPQEVDSVLSHRIIRNRQVIAAVSGGVTVDPHSLVRKSSIRTDNYGLLSGTHESASASNIPVEKWWWDSPDL